MPEQEGIPGPVLGPIDDKEIARAFLSTEDVDYNDLEIPDPDHLWQAFTGELSLDERVALVDQATSCPLTAVAFRVARQLVQEAQRELGEDSGAVSASKLSSATISLVESGAQVTPPRELFVDPEKKLPKGDPQIHSQTTDDAKILRPGRWNAKLRRALTGCGILATAAAMALVVLRQEPKRSAGNWREYPKTGTISVHKEGYSFSRGQFSWPAHEDAKHYELQLVDPSIKEICKIVVHEPSYLVDASNCPGYTPGRAFFWRVRTLRLKGKESVSSYFSANAQ